MPSAGQYPFSFILDMWACQCLWANLPVTTQKTLSPRPRLIVDARLALAKCGLDRRAPPMKPLPVSTTSTRLHSWRETASAWSTSP